MGQSTPTKDTGASHEARKLFDLADEVKVAMLATKEEDGSIRSRPMYCSDIDGEGNLWFFTKASAHKTFEIEGDHRVNVAFSDPDDENYASISGKALLVRDKERIDALWSLPMKTWFPDGKDDPDVALLKISPEYGEYWDSPSQTAVYLYGLAKTSLTGEPPKPGDHGKVQRL
jgi:general stress protein 26